MGRPPKLTEAEHARIRELYYEKAPNGKPYTLPMLARLYRVSPATIAHVLNRRTPSREEWQS